MNRLLAAIVCVLTFTTLAQAQTTIYWKRDHIYAGPGGGEIATITPAPSDTTAPTTPSGLGASGTTATSVYLSWTGSTDSGGSGLAGYKIYRQKGSGASLPVGTVNSSTTAFTDQPLEANTGYTWTIVAFDNAQNHSSVSSGASATTSATSTDTTAPSAPPNLRGLDTSWTTHKVRLDWDGATDAGGSGVAGYKVYRDDTLISGSSPITNRYYEDTTYTANTAFTYKVKTVDGAGNVSGYSNAATVTTLRQSGGVEGFNYADAFASYDEEWVYHNNTLHRAPNMMLTYFRDWVVNTSVSSFTASVKILNRNTSSSGSLSSGFSFWGSLGTGDPADEANYCQDGPADPDHSGEHLGQDLWYPDAGLYRVYESDGALYLYYWSSCSSYTPDLLGYSVSVPAGPGVLKVDANSTTRRIKVYWNGTLKIDYTDSNTSRPNVGALTLTGMQSSADLPWQGSMFDDLLLEQ